MKMIICEFYYRNTKIILSTHFDQAKKYEYKCFVTITFINNVSSNFFFFREKELKHLPCHYKFQSNLHLQ